jgi:hypothetical protein
MGPVPLTRQEVANVVRRQVSQFEEIGLTHDAAVLAVARKHAVEPHKIAALAPALPEEGDQEQT